MIKKLIGAIALSMLFAAHANAATLSISGPGSVMVGDSFQIVITGSGFDQGLGAGGIDFMYDAALVQLDMITLNVPFDPTFSCPGAAGCPGDSAGLTTIVWGNFTGPVIAPGAAPTIMATLSFTALSAAEATAFFNMVTNDNVTGGWFLPLIAGTIATPTFEGYAMDITSTVVPLPAAVWFMIGGLGTLLGFRRK